MNILFYQDTIGVSGAEKYIADAAGRLRERGHGVSFACPRRSWMETQAVHRGFPYFDFSIENDTDDHLHWALTKHLITHEIDIVFCSTPGKRPEVPRIHEAIKAAGRGRIVIRVGVCPGSDRAFEPERLGIGYATVDGIVAVSEDIRGNLLEFYPQLHPSEVHVLYNGVDLDAYSQDRTSTAESQKMRRSLGVPAGNTVVAAIGRLDPIKNLPLLVDAAEHIILQKPKTSFVIAGHGTQRETLEQLVIQRALEDHIHFLGEIEDIAKLLSAVDIVCHPSLSEGVPNTLLESMAAGKAIVASDVGGITELIKDDETGYLFPVGSRDALTEQLLKLPDSPTETSRLSEAARQRVENHFDRSTNIRSLEALLLG